jgi:hypothetical protein
MSISRWNDDRYLNTHPGGPDGRLLQPRAHWRSVLPVPWLELPYEQLVSDTEEVIKGLLSFCDIEWEPACVQFHETRRGVRTPSRWQVRQPMYGHSVGRWRPYERQLRPLREILLQQHITEDTERLN